MIDLWRPASEAALERAEGPGRSRSRLSITAIVLTYNEALHIERCLSRIMPLVERVVVVDSFSTDRTVEIARAMGAEVLQHAFKNNASQFQWALDEITISTAWIMKIDADEYIDAEAHSWLQASLAGLDEETVALELKLKVIFKGRFIRHGRTFDHWMVANACMHCADPVCMIGCPTGAIHRSIGSGAVVINDTTCIGCGTCANSCPYNNIRLVEIRDVGGKPVRDPESQKPILKATKCDLCETNPGGPACVRACPHDALRRVDFRSGDTFRSLG